MKNFLTHSLEDYLEMIYIISENKGSARITDIAKAFSFSKPSVSQAISLLKKEDFVNQERYGKITLTSKGLKEARLIYNRHKILNEFFIKILNVNPKTAEIDACKAEHILSLETLKSIENLLNKVRNRGKNFDEQ